MDQKTKKQTTFFNRKNRVRIIIGFLATLLLVFFFTAAPIFSNKLSKISFDFQEKQYRLKTSDVTFQPLRLGFSLRNFEIIENNTNSVFNCQQLSISYLNVLDLIFFSELSAHSVIVEDSKTTFDFNALISDTLQGQEVFKIPGFNRIHFHEVVLKNAKFAYANFDHLNSQFVIPQIDLVLKDFAITNSKTTNNPAFSISDFQLKANNFSYHFNDEFHQLNAETVVVSLLRNEVLLNKVRLVANETKLTDRLKVRIETPTIKAIVQNLNELSTTDSINLKSLEIDYPEILLSKGTHQVQKKLSLQSILSDQLKSVVIDRFVLKNGNLKLIESKSKTNLQVINRVNLKAFGWAIQPSSFNNKNRILGAEGILLSVEKYTNDALDGIHRLTIHELKFDTRLKNLSTDFISFSPIVSIEKNTDKTFFNINSPGIYLRGLNFHDLFQEQRFYASEFKLKSPDIKVQSFRKQENLNADFNTIQHYFKQVKIDEFSILDGYFNYEKQVAESKTLKSRFEINLRKINIDKDQNIDQKSLFFADDYQVNLSGLTFTNASINSRIAAESIDFSNKKKIAEIKNFRIITDDDLLADSVKYSLNKTFTNITIPVIKINETNLHDIFYHKKLLAKSILINEPRISIDQYGKKLKNEFDFEQKLDEIVHSYFEQIDVEQVIFNEGSLYFTNFVSPEKETNWSNKFTVKLNSFEVDSSMYSKRFLYSNNLEASIQNLNFDISKGQHTVDIHKVEINTNKHIIRLEKVNLFPNFNEEIAALLPTKISATIPAIQFNAINLREIVLERKLEVSSIDVVAPNVQITKQEVPSINNHNSGNLLNKSFSYLKAASVTIKNGSFSNALTENDVHHVYTTIDYQASLKNFSFETNTNKTYFTNLSFDANYLNHEFKNGYYINTNQLNYSQKEQSLVISDFYIGANKKVKQTADKNYFDVSIPSLELKEFDIRKVLNDQTISGNVLTVNEPSLNFNERKASSKKIQPYQLAIYDKIKTQLKAISIRQVVINNADYTIRKDESKYFRNIVGDEFLVNATSENNSLPFNFQKISLQLKNFSGKSKNEFYNYSIGTVNLNSNGLIVIKDLSLFPTYSKNDFFERKQFQDDYFVVNLKDAVLSDIDYKRFFEKDELVVSKLKCDFDKVSIYRDKRFPIQPDKITHLPTSILRNLQQKIHLTHSNLTCKELVYEELELQAKKESKIFFTNISIHSNNVSNIAAFTNQNSISHLNLKGKIFGVGNLDVNMDFQLNSPIDEFRLTASCGQIPLMLANSISEPGLKLSIKDGINQKLEVDFIANQDSASGYLLFYYNDLKVSVLSNKSGDLKEQAFVSFLANAMVKSDNPRQPGKPVEIGYFVNHRDKQRSVVNYSWKSIFEGMKASLGMKPKN